MALATDAVLALIASARGERTYSLDNREVEDVLTIALSLLVELSVANDRIDRLERLVAELRGGTLADVRGIVYAGDEEAERGDATDALLARVLRVMVDPRVG